MMKWPNSTWRVEGRVRALYELLISSGPKFTCERLDGNARQRASHEAFAFWNLLKIRLAKDKVRKSITPDLSNDLQQNGTICAACVLTPPSESWIESPSESSVKHCIFLITRAGTDHVQDTVCGATFAVSGSEFSRMPRILRSLPR